MAELRMEKEARAEAHRAHFTFHSKDSGELLEHFEGGDVLMRHRGFKRPPEL